MRLGDATRIRAGRLAAMLNAPVDFPSPVDSRKLRGLATASGDPPRWPYRLSSGWPHAACLGERAGGAKDSATRAEPAPAACGGGRSEWKES